MPGAAQYSVTRNTGAYVSGSWVAGTPSTVQPWMSVQPLDGRDLLLIAEGDRTKEIIKLYSSLALQTQGDGQMADTFTYNGKTFLVDQVQAWGPFWKVIAKAQGG